MSTTVKPPGTLLAIETATDVCSVALWRAGASRIVSNRTHPRSHAEHLTPMIGQVLRYEGLTVSALDAIAVSMGPGSYTGLRIGASTAKGLAFAHDVALIGVPSLHALAQAARGQLDPGQTLCVAFNARRNEVYLQRFRAGEAHTIESLDEVVALHRDEILAYIDLRDDAPLVVAGEGAAVVVEAIGHERAKVLPAHSVAPSAQFVAELGAHLYREGRREDPATFEPFYLKAFIPRKQATSVFDRLPF